MVSQQQTKIVLNYLVIQSRQKSKGSLVIYVFFKLIFSKKYIFFIRKTKTKISTLYHNL